MAESSPVIYMEGLFAVDQSAAIEQQLLEEVEKGVTQLVLDFQKVTVLDSTGIGVLISVQNNLLKKGGALEIVNVSRDIFRLFQIMRLDNYFKVTTQE